MMLLVLIALSLLILVIAGDKCLYQRYCARVMYDGSGFRGWQEQSDVRTVQGTISKRLSQRFDRSMRVTGASRTDQGVHARGQAIHFDLPLDISATYQDQVSLDRLEYSLNRILPDDIRIYNISLAPLGNSEQVRDGDLWHATKSANRKIYTYRFCTNQFVDPLQRRYCAHVYREFNEDIFCKCLPIFIGTHDFAAYTNRVEHSVIEFKEKGFDFCTTKTINNIEFFNEGNGYYRVEVDVESALYRMIRNIMGASLMVAAEHDPAMNMETIKYLLHESPNRNFNKAGSAPAEGLTLERVFYDHY